MRFALLCQHVQTYEIVVACRGRYVDCKRFGLPQYLRPIGVVWAPTASEHTGPVAGLEPAAVATPENAGRRFPVPSAN